MGSSVAAPCPGYRRFAAGWRLPALAAFGLLFLASPVRAQFEGLTINQIFEAGREAVIARYPGLLETEALRDGISLTGIGDDQIESLYAQIFAGEWNSDMALAFRTIFAGLSEQAGLVGVEGREILQALAGVAGESRNGEVLRGVASVLAEIMNNAAHPYTLLAQDLLSEKLRCGAASAGENELIVEIAAMVDPDRAYEFAGTDGTVGDRYGLHHAADLFSVATRGQQVVAAGYFGTLLVSHDSGETWSAPDTGTDEPLFAVSPGGEDEWWAVGRGGVVLHSTDGAQSFERRPTPFQRHYFGVIATGPGASLVVGDFGLQLATGDGGGSWTCLPREEDVILGRVVPAGPDALMVGEFGTLERLPGREPPGEPGRVSGVPDDIYLFDAWFEADGRVGLAVGLSGTVLRSEDGGESWAPLQTDFDADLYGVGGSAGRVWVVGESGFWAWSEDGGMSFEAGGAASVSVSLHDISFDEAGRGFAVGLRGAIFRTDGTGRALVPVHPGPNR